MYVVFLIIACLILLTMAGLWVKMERRVLPHRSTIEFWRLSDLPFFKKLEGYIYAARADWYLKPVTWSWFRHRFVKNESADTYHGKLMTHHDAVKLISLKQAVELTELEHVIPYPLARSLILQEPLPSLAVMECPCRAQKKNSCQPQDVCLVMGEPFTSFIVDHQPERARRITVDEALQIIAEEEQRGHIHTAWFKDAMHNRFYTICNCCSCCCLGMESVSRGVKRLSHSGYSPLIDDQACVACGNCKSICPFAAVNLDANRPVINMDLCMGCGLCVTHCPTHALSLSLSPHKGTPLNIERLADIKPVNQVIPKTAPPAPDQTEFRHSE